MEDERRYTTREAAEYLGIPMHRVYDLGATGQLERETLEEPYQGSKYRYKQGTLDKWKAQNREEAALVLESREIEAAPTTSDEDIMHTILTKLYAFLRQFEYSLEIRAMRKVDPGDMQLWAIETADIDLHVVTEAGNTHIISPQNQKYLELLNSELMKRLKTAETLLSFMRKRPIDYVLNEYSHELLVRIEPREKGFLVTCEQYPRIGAIGPTEEEAIKTFKGLLFGYAYHLETHLSELTPEMKAQFQALKELYLEV